MSEKQKHKPPTSKEQWQKLKTAKTPQEDLIYNKFSALFMDEKQEENTNTNMKTTLQITAVNFFPLKNRKIKDTQS